MYNRYIPGSGGYTRIPEEDDQPIRRSETGTHRLESPHPPHSEAVSKAEKAAGSLTSLLKSLKLDQLDSSAGVIANERQRSCVEEAWKTMEQAKQALDGGETLDAVNVCIDSAIDSLLELTGERASNAVIDQVFERFCVGK